MRVRCLHTAASNAALFDAACPPGTMLMHTIRPDLLARAEAEGGMSAALAADTATLLRALAAEADAVLLTCSTLGPAADGVPGAARADAALADALAPGDGRALALCAAPTTLAPIRALFGRAAPAVGVELVEGAWPLFRAGTLDAYYARVAAAVDAAFSRGVARVGLVQASMAPAAALCRRGTPLAAPAAALRALAGR